MNYKIIKYLFIIFLTSIFFLSQISADNLKRLPIISSIVSIENIRILFKSSNNELDATIPNIKSNSEIDNVLNKEINGFTYKIIETFFNEQNRHYTKIDYEVVTDNYYWFTIKIKVFETMASSSNYSKYYHIDKFANAIVNLGDLFKNNNYIEAISSNIKEQMHKRMKNNPNIIYWLSDEEKTDDFISINPNQNFYFNKKGELVIVFNEYEVSPGYMGNQEFIINSCIYQEYLK